MSVHARLTTTVLGLASVLSLAACSDGAGESTTGGSGGATTTSAGSGGGGSGAAGGSGGSGGAGGSGGGGTSVECANLPIGPLEPKLVVDVLNGSEDFAFDGKGNIAAKAGTEIVLVDAAGKITTLATGIPSAYGLRYRPDGHLAVALPTEGKLIDVSPEGVVTDLATGLGGPNGVYPDFDGSIWVTQFGSSKVSRINPDDTVSTIVSGAAASSANGIVYDSKRMQLFYTNYQAGKIRRVSLVPDADPTPVEVVKITGAALDGLAMDVCGNLYVVDQGDSRVYRVRLDENLAAIGEAELLAEFPKNVANVQFGAGPGFDAKTLYAAGTPGSVYAVSVGVAGAPVPSPP